MALRAIGIEIGPHAVLERRAGPRERDHPVERREIFLLDLLVEQSERAETEKVGAVERARLDAEDESGAGRVAEEAVVSAGVGPNLPFSIALQVLARSVGKQVGIAPIVPPFVGDAGRGEGVEPSAFIFE